MADFDDLAAQKQLLIAQANLDRLNIALAAHEVRRIVWPGADSVRGDAARSIASRVIGLAMPLFGRSRLARVVHGLSIGLMVYRVLRGFRR